jgi:HEAT repeat protein
VALQLLDRYSDADCVPVMIGALEDENSSVRSQAAELLAQTKDPRAYEPLAALLLIDRGLAGKCLREIGSPALEAVIPYVDHQDLQVQLAVINIVAEIGTDEAVAVLDQCLTHPNPQVRHETLRKLGDLADPRTVSLVCKRLLSPEDRSRAGRCLVRMGSMVEETVILGLQHSDPDVVRECCSVLQIVGTEKCLPALAKLLEEGSDSVQQHALNAGRTIHQRVSADADRAAK